MKFHAARLCAAAGLSVLALAQNAELVPMQMEQVMRLIGGKWRCDGGLVEFNQNPGSAMLIGRARPNDPNSRWRRMMLIFPEGRQVRAEFFDAKDHVTHYRLAEAGGDALHFADDPPAGMPIHRLTYERAGNTVAYKFETGDKIVEIGVLRRDTLIHPLSE